MRQYFKHNAVVLFQGDSITDCGRTDRNNRPNAMGNGYPAKIQAIYQALFPAADVTFVNRAVSGNRVRDLLARYENDFLAVQPDYISILIGINDTWRGFDNGDPCPLARFRKEYTELLKKIKAIVKAMGKEKGARILGIHLEGPFLSPERIGAQSKEGISSVDMKLMEHLWKASKGKLINMTVAPELKGMRELALYCINKGIVLQAGHTNATYNQMIEGMQAGIMHVTHLFDAMRPLHHREPGVVGAALIHPELSCEIIGDGVHVNPNLIHLLMKSKPLSQIVMITDALPPAKTILPEDSELYLDKVFYRKKDNVINGSAISMLDGFCNLVSYGIPIEKVIHMASSNPARIMRKEDLGLLLPGKKADVIVLEKDLSLRYTIIDGKFIKEK